MARFGVLIAGALTAQRQAGCDCTNSIGILGHDRDAGLEQVREFEVVEAHQRDTGLGGGQRPQGLAGRGEP